MSNINDWIILHKLDDELKSKIKFFFIFGESGEEVLIVTNDDNVFAFGINKNGLLGLGHNNKTEKPTIVEELCNKQIIDIRSGKEHMIALSKTGLCYSWGCNRSGQLGNGSKIGGNKPKIINGLINSKIKVIACGAYHSIVVTNKGEVYGFGNNSNGQIGCNNNDNQLTPILINGFNNKKVTTISCGRHHSLALTESGHVFSWGFNGEGELGIGNNEINQNTPQLVNMNGFIVKKISSGSRTNLLLSSDGNIYGFGLNNLGQIGNGCRNSTKIPLKINNNKFILIASSFHSYISVAKSEEGFHVWGGTTFGDILSPIETGFKSIHEVFAFYSNEKITYEPIYVKEEIIKRYQNPIIDRVTNAFNNPEFSDCQFKIDDKVIYVHKVILKINCEHFKAMFSENWDKNETKEIEINSYSYKTYYAFLKYIYTNCVEIGFEDVIELYDLANSYCEKDLKQKCINIIKNEISIENAFNVYSSAVEYNSQELEEICLKFAINNMNNVCNTEDFQKMDVILLKSLIEKTLKDWTISSHHK